MTPNQDSISRRALLGTAAAGGAVLAAGILAAPGSVAAAPKDQIQSISITVDQVELAIFSELMGITTEVEPVETQEGDPVGPILKKLPGKLKVSNVILRRPLSDDLNIAAWMEAVALGDLLAATRDVVVTVQNGAKQTVVRYHLSDAWPSKLEVGPVDGERGLFETLTLNSDLNQRISA